MLLRLRNMPSGSGYSHTLQDIWHACMHHVMLYTRGHASPPAASAVKLRPGHQVLCEGGFSTRVHKRIRCRQQPWNPTNGGSPIPTLHSVLDPQLLRLERVQLA